MGSRCANTQELLKRIRSDKLESYDFSGGKILDLEYDVDIISLSHEVDVVHAPMFCLFMLHGYDINGKSIYHQTLDKILKRKLKKFLLHKRKLKENGDVSNEYLKITNKIKKTRETIKVLKIVRKLIADNDPCDFQPEISEEDLWCAVPVEETIRQSLAFYGVEGMNSNKNLEDDPNMYMKIDKFITSMWKGYRQERLHVKELLKRGRCCRDKIEQIARNMSDEAISSLCQNTDGTPKLLFHGGTKKIEANFLQLSHCGSFRAAYDRLYNCTTDGRYHNSASKMIPLYLKMKSPYRIVDYTNHDLNGYKMTLVYILFAQSKGIDFCSKKIFQHSKKPCLRKMFLDFELPPEIDYIFNHPMRMDMRHVYDELTLRRVYSLDLSEDKEKREQNNRERLIWSRFIHYFEKQGYDGFVYQNWQEDIGSDSYVCFRQDQFLYAADENIEAKIQENPYKYRDEKRLAALEAQQMKECSKTHLTEKEAYMYPFYFEYFVKDAEQFGLYNKQKNTNAKKCISHGTKYNMMSLFFNKIKTLCHT